MWPAHVMERYLARKKDMVADPQCNECMKRLHRADWWAWRGSLGKPLGREQSKGNRDCEDYGDSFWSDGMLCN